MGNFLKRAYVNLMLRKDPEYMLGVDTINKICELERLEDLGKAIAECTHEELKTLNYRLTMIIEKLKEKGAYLE